ncbi:helix-turn-helix domain-containing protein [Devosia elaeis]|uniref:helix-turn-helix domain-containing protein n=1 Tax=Devosia elaeis TaxID=1770058 RepID=UPI0013F4C121
MALLTPKEAAERLGVSTDQLLKLTDRGKLPFINVGLGQKRPSRRYDPDDLSAFMMAQRMTACPSSSAKAPKSTLTTSGLRVVDFSAARKRKTSEQPRP